MKCKHFKKNGYRYEFNDEELNLCDKCEMELLIKMQSQKILEDKRYKSEVEVLFNETGVLFNDVSNIERRLNKIVDRIKDEKIKKQKKH